jgi:hypothetical protein
MRMPLSQHAEERLGQSALVLITERVDDVARLIGQMITMGWPEVLERPSPRPGKQRGLRWGWTAVMWLAHMRPEGDHRQGAGAGYRKGLPHPLSRLTAQVLPPLACRDARLSPLLTHVRTPQDWPQIERDVHERRFEGHAWPQEGLRGEATTVSGAHAVTTEGLLQCGQSQEDPTRPQSKVMTGSLAPWGRPLATDGLAGDRADEGVSLALLERLRPGVQTTGRLLVGDGQRRALATRAAIVGHHAVSGSPLP